MSDWVLAHWILHCTDSKQLNKHPKTFSMRKKMGVEEVVESVMIEADLIKKRERYQNKIIITKMSHIM